jgi:uncharacterized integral membrane protein
MLYVITDILLKVAFNTNKTGHHVICYTWHIIGSGVQHQKYWWPCYTFICTTHYWRWCSTPIILVTMLYVITDILLEVTFNTNKTGHHAICYTWHIIGGGVQHQLYWSPCYTFICTTHYWRWCSTPIILVTMLYVITDILLEVTFNTNKTGHHAICYTWHIIGGGVQHQ